MLHGCIENSTNECRNTRLQVIDLSKEGNKISVHRVELCTANKNIIEMDEQLYVTFRDESHAVQLLSWPVLTDPTIVR